MTDEQPTDLDRALEGFIAQWPKDAFKDSSEQKTLLLGNLRGFVAFLGILKLDALLERLAYDVEAGNIATGTVTRFEEFKANMAKIDRLIEMQR